MLVNLVSIISTNMPLQREKQKVFETFYQPKEYGKGGKRTSIVQKNYDSITENATEILII